MKGFSVNAYQNKAYYKLENSYYCKSFVYELTMGYNSLIFFNLYSLELCKKVLTEKAVTKLSTLWQR